MSVSMYSVYIADDEMWVIVGLKKRIEKTGLPFQVIGEANNGVMALEEIEKKKPDILFTDIRMPGYSGLELLELLRKKELQTKVILISGYAEFEYAQSAIRNGAYDYLLKPIVRADIQSACKKEQYTENITLTGLAEKYAISVSYLSELLKEHLQLSFSEYISSKRIQKAKELLADESLSIEQIAEQTGYNDYFYFTKVFKKNTGISPSKYRKNLLEH